jgi:hypothetical protein
MLNTDREQNKTSWRMSEFELTPNQLEQLIREKFERNNICFDTRKREALLVESR